METITFDHIANEHYFDSNKIKILKNILAEELSFGALDDYINTDDKKKSLTKYVKKHCNNVKTGDTLVFCDPEQKYRNAGTCLWNGNSIELLDHGIDEYGALPKFFEISPGKFGPRYWQNVIRHNDYYWICANYRHEAYDNVEIIQKLENNKIKDYFVTKYTHNGITEYLVLNEDDVDENYTIEKFKKLLLNENIPFGFDGFEYHHLFESENVSIVNDFEYNNEETIIDVATDEEI